MGYCNAIVAQYINKCDHKLYLSEKLYLLH